MENLIFVNMKEYIKFLTLQNVYFTTLQHLKYKRRKHKKIYFPQEASRYRVLPDRPPGDALTAQLNII